MNFIIENKLPFREAFVDGSICYICDIGNIRLITNDASIINTDDYKYNNPISGEVIIADYSLNLPTNVKLTAHSTIANTYVISKDNHYVLMVGKQTPSNPESIGSLTLDSYDSSIDYQNSIIYDYKYHLFSKNNRFSNLQGVIINCGFDGNVPSYFNHKFTSMIITDSYQDSEEINFEYGTQTSSDSTAGNLIANSEAEMLAFTNTIAGTGCFRTDSDILYINITGDNGSLDDWKATNSSSSNEDILEIINNSMVQSPNAFLLEIPFRNSLDITKGKGSVVFTRASTALYDDRYGFTRSAAINEPRFVKSGLLIEPSSTNYFVGSKDATQFETVNCSIFENVKYDPSHNLTADSVVIDTPGTDWYIYKTINELTLIQGTYVTFSIRMSSSNNTRVLIELLDSTGTNNFNFSEEITLNKFLTRYKNLTVFVENATIGKLVIKISGIDKTINDVFVINDMQVENLPVSTSEITTTVETGIVTRALDDVAVAYFGNFPGSFSDKTVSVDINILGRLGELSSCFYSGDLQLFIDDNTEVNKTSVGMSLSEKSDWIEKTGVFRFGATYNNTTKELCMYHDGIKVATKTITIVDPPTDTVNSYDQFLAEIYPTIASGEYLTSILQIPLDVVESIIKLNYGSPFFTISNLRIVDQCLTENQMKVF